MPYCDIAVSRKREPSARIYPWQIDERRQQRCRVLVTIPCQQKRESKCSAFIVPYCDIAVSRKREPSARICPWQIDERRQQRCRVLVTIPCQQKRESILLSLFCWQGRRDSNTQPTVLETATLPLSHSPIKPVYFTIIQNESQEFLIVF